MGGQSTQGPIEAQMVKTRGYLGEGAPGHGVWSSVPFDTSLAERQKMAAKESQQYDPKKYANDLEDWLKPRLKDPNMSVGGAPFPTDELTNRQQVLQKGQQMLKLLRGFYDT